ncbi:MAG: Anaphase-promoting complex subunit 1, partial [Pleopsidium flavum]
MASVTSLGIHWPCALQHLVAESILPHDPANDQYDWQTIDGSDDGENNSEELLTTKHCVVWSQGGIVRRVFRFEVENEGVVQAILTWFPTEDTRNKPDRSEGANRQTTATANTSRRSRRVSNDCGKAAGSCPSSESQSSRSPDTGDYLQQCQQESLSSLKRRDRARALVVVLRTQAHIYFLSGTSHVLNLPFEVDSILPTPRGLLLQRKIPIQPAAPNSPVDQLVPPNSFVSPQTQPWTPQGLQFGLYCLGSGISSKPSTQATSVPAIVSGPYQADANANLPRLFSLTDTMSELGLVVEAPTAGSTLDSLSHAEDIIYVSKLDELYNESLSKSTPSLLFAVTSNEQTGMHTVWSLSYVEPQSVSARARMWTPTTSDTLSRRRSSHGLTGAGTGATTPMGRGPISTRESFGMRTRNHNVPGSSNVNMSITSTGEDINLDAGNELASQLDLEFENPGAPAKSSRRVRSLLARADLSTSHDKLAFSDLVTGHPSTASGYAAGNRRGESFGGYSSRGSFGYSVGPSRRGSVPANSFNLSVSNFHNTPADDLVEDVNDDHHLGDFEGSGHHVAVRGLRKEVVLTRIGSFPIQRSEVERLTRKDNMPSKIKVFTMLPPPSPVVDEHEGAIIYICIVNRTDRKLLVLKVEIKQRAGPRSSQNTHFDLTTDLSAVSRATKAKVTEMRRAQGIIDVCRLTHGDIHRMLVLSETDDGHGEITLQAPWSTLVRLELPSMLAIYHPFHIGRAVSPSRRREGGLKRVLSEGPRELIGLQHEAHGGEVDLVDAEGTRHRVKVQLIPHDSQVVKVLRVCQFVLPGSDYGGDGILVGWWEVNRWFQSMGEAVVDHEWAALVVVLFAMAVNFISDKQSHGAAKQRKRKTGLLRSSSGAKVDLENWDSMLDEEGSSHGALPRWSKGAGWEWIMDQEDQLMVSDQKAGGSTRSTRSSSTATTSITTITRHNGFLVRCASLAREFLKSPAGRAASGEQGYLPTAASKDPEIQRTALATVLIGLHLLEEDAKLDIATPDKSRHGFGRLTPILAQIGGWLGWENWSWKENAYYSVEDVEMNKWLFED